MAFWLLCFGLKPKRKVVQTQKMKPIAIQESIRDQPLSSYANPSRTTSDPEALLPPNIETKNFTYQQLATATNNFSRVSWIGSGGFGAVFKGKLEINGLLKDVAIKMLDPRGKQGDKEFLAEVLMLTNCRNKNLVNLYGYCSEGDHRGLVYEYMPLGSVEDNIHNLKPTQEGLDLSTRLKIALGAAKGLAYLHNEAQPAVIYRDMKTANILLDHEFQPKLSDFGLAKIGPEDGMSHVTTIVMGTLGYCAPEYAATGKLTMKSDIYSFGVVMLELITGRKPIGDSSRGAQRILVHWARPYFMKKNLSKITDPMLEKQGHPHFKKTVRKAVQIAYTCLRDNAKARPEIGEVVNALEFLVEGISRKKVEGSTVYEKDEGFKRQKDLADAKWWATS